MLSKIDGFGQARNRRGVRMVQRAQGSQIRMAAAEIRRNTRRAKLAHGPDVIVLSPFPKGGITIGAPDGAYVQGGGGFERGRYQIVVVGRLRGSADDYREALSAWLKKPVQTISFEVLDGPDDPSLRETWLSRGFTSMILEPGDQT